MYCLTVPVSQINDFKVSWKQVKIDDVFIFSPVWEEQLNSCKRLLNGYAFCLLSLEGSLSAWYCLQRSSVTRPVVLLLSCVPKDLFPFRSHLCLYAFVTVYLKLVQLVWKLVEFLFRFSENMSDPLFQYSFLFSLHFPSVLHFNLLFTVLSKHIGSLRWLIMMCYPGRKLKGNGFLEQEQDIKKVTFWRRSSHNANLVLRCWLMA